MKFSMNCCICCFGVGMIVGAVIVANNRKVQNMVKEGSETVSNAIDEIKESVKDQKQNIQSKLKEN